MPKYPVLAPPEVFLVMPKDKLKAHLRQTLETLRQGNIRKFSREACQELICPSSYWHDLDSPEVQDIFIELQESGLVTLAYFEHFYLYVKSTEEERAEMPLQIETGRIARLKKSKTLQG